MWLIIQNVILRLRHLKTFLTPITSDYPALFSGHTTWVSAQQMESTLNSEISTCCRSGLRSCLTGAFIGESCVFLLSFEQLVVGLTWIRVAAWQGSCQTLGLWRQVMACVSCYLKGVNDRAMVKPIVLSNYYWDFNLGIIEALSRRCYGVVILLRF